MVLLEGVETLTFEMVKNAALVIIILYGFNEVICKIYTKIKAKVKKEDKIDALDPEQIKKDIHIFMDERYNSITKKYDDELASINLRIDENHNDTTAKFQEMMAELYLQTECMEAVFEGLHQLECNGPVTVAKERLHKHIKHRAYPDGYPDDHLED